MRELTTGKAGVLMGSGATPSDDTDSLAEEPSVGLRTTAGEVERESLSRRANAVEALGVMVFILVVLWPMGYYLGVLQGVELAEPLCNLVLILGGAYLLLVAPFIHRDSATSWGLGDPGTVLDLLGRGPAWRRAGFGAVLLTLFLGLNYANYVNWDEVTDFFKVEDTVIAGFDHGYPGRFVVFGFGSVLSAIIVLFAIRYDNFGSAFLTALKIALPLLCIVCVAAYAQRGPEAFTSIRPVDWVAGVFGYVFWGFVQQLLFSAYFGTRFRKAFAPAPAPRQRPTLGRWTLKSLLIGANLGLGAYVVSLFGLRLLHGVSAVALDVPLIIGALGFVFGVVYGFFYALDPRRMLVATLTASCFGLIHIDSYYLVAATWLLGIPLTYVFMEDRNRNLVALGFVHGLLGSTLGNLFSEGQSGLFEIDYAVGPYNVAFPTREVMIVPLLCIAAYVGLMLWCVRNLSNEEPREPVGEDPGGVAQSRG